ncbi:hypothetical protein C7M84_014716 [Penaeus vannamei]|uniref:Uncharacterized protein n=1 Tax=Penaeus vannamei TaxID=6689 RepID=A0A3R7LXL2_PENVA|nr:hypothetical protein C7M84_014716 [Penaeus vannamei]
MRSVQVASTAPHKQRHTGVFIVCLFSVSFSLLFLLPPRPNSSLLSPALSLFPTRPSPLLSLYLSPLSLVLLFFSPFLRPTSLSFSRLFVFTRAPQSHLIICLLFLSFFSFSPFSVLLLSPFPGLSFFTRPLPPPKRSILSLFLSRSLLFLLPFSVATFSLLSRPSLYLVSLFLLSSLLFLPASYRPTISLLSLPFPFSLAYPIPALSVSLLSFSSLFPPSLRPNFSHRFPRPFPFSLLYLSPLSLVLSLFSPFLRPTSFSFSRPLNLSLSINLFLSFSPTCSFSVPLLSFFFDFFSYSSVPPFSALAYLSSAYIQKRLFISFSLPLRSVLPLPPPPSLSLPLHSSPLLLLTSVSPLTPPLLSRLLTPPSLSLFSSPLSLPALLSLLLSLSHPLLLTSSSLSPLTPPPLSLSPLSLSLLPLSPHPLSLPLHSFLSLLPPVSPSHSSPLSPSPSLCPLLSSLSPHSLLPSPSPAHSSPLSLSSINILHTRLVHQLSPRCRKQQLHPQLLQKRNKLAPSLAVASYKPDAAFRFHLARQERRTLLKWKERSSQGGWLRVQGLAGLLGRVFSLALAPPPLFAAFEIRLNV